MFLQVLKNQEKEAFLELAHLVANANGVVDEREKKVIEQYDIEMGLNVKVEELQELTLDQIVEAFTNEESKKVAFLEAIALAFADQIYHEEQKKMINELREAFGFSQEYYQEVKQWIIDFNKIYAKGTSLVSDKEAIV
jgi:tellurite resistance protein